MRKLHMCLIIHSSGKDYVSIILFPLMVLELDFTNVIYSRWVISMAPQPVYWKKNQSNINIT